MRSSLALALSAGAVIGAALAPGAASAATHGPAAARRTITADRKASLRAPGARHAPAGGDPATAVTFTVTSGALTLTAPISANLGSGAPGTVISNVLGTVTVTDNRALLAAAWTVSASSTSFTTGGGTANEIIPATDATYSPGSVTTTGTITATPTNITLSSTAQTVVTGTAGVGDNTASWNPTIAVSVPVAAVTGGYAGTLTESVA
jgi:hypothetical protein